MRDLQEIVIDGGVPVRGSLRYGHEMLDISSNIATKPDPTWTYADPAGHFHAYSGNDLPTLTPQQVHIECNGVHVGPLSDPDEPCEGYDVTEYRCRACGDEVKPRRVSDAGPKSMPGRPWWTVEVEQQVPFQQTVSVKVIRQDDVHFGFATAASFHAEGNGRTVTRLTGVSPLGRMHRVDRAA
jgi:hypothetical protein